MGREIKRVPLDFDWPLDTTWSGFLMPDELRVPDCPDCKGMSTTPARQWVEQIAALLLLLDDDLNAQERGRDMHPYFHHTGSRARSGRPSPDIREFGSGLAGREASWLGHDAIDNWHATDAVIRAAGLDPKVWGLCRTCEGNGSIEAYPGQRAEVDAWERTEPPTGEGWQVWQTVGEGSPITPVLPTAEALIDHLATIGTVWDDGKPWRRSAAEAFVGDGWAPSGFASAAGVFEGGRDSDLMPSGGAS